MSDRIRSIMLFTGLLIATACGGGSDTSSGAAAGSAAAVPTGTAVGPATGATPATAPAVCGNGKLETGELCDGANLNGQTCASMGLNAKGMLLCKSDCKTFDTIMCLASSAAAAPVGGAGAAQGGSGARTTGTAGAGGSGR